MLSRFPRFFYLAIVLFIGPPCVAQQAAIPATTEGDFVVHDFKFRSGETLPELRLHYTTLGKPVRDAQGRVTNAVLILHGTGGAGNQFLQPIFAGELFRPGQLLDAGRLQPRSIGPLAGRRPQMASRAVETGKAAAVND